MGQEGKALLRVLPLLRRLSLKESSHLVLPIATGIISEIVTIVVIVIVIVGANVVLDVVIPFLQLLQRIYNICVVPALSSRQHIRILTLIPMQHTNLFRLIP